MPLSGSIPELPHVEKGQPRPTERIRSAAMEFAARKSFDFITLLHHAIAAEVLENCVAAVARVPNDIDPAVADFDLLDAQNPLPTAFESDNQARWLKIIYCHFAPATEESFCDEGLVGPATVAIRYENK
jgi:hypothetical protein